MITQQYIEAIWNVGWYLVLNKSTRVVNEAESCIDHKCANNLINGIRPSIIL